MSILMIFQTITMDSPVKKWFCSRIQDLITKAFVLLWPSLSPGAVWVRKYKKLRCYWLKVMWSVLKTADLNDCIHISLTFCKLTNQGRLFLFLCTIHCAIFIAFSCSGAYFQTPIPTLISCLPFAELIVQSLSVCPSGPWSSPVTRLLRGH